MFAENNTDNANVNEERVRCKMLNLIMMVVKVTTMSYFAKKDTFKSKKNLSLFAKILTFVCKQLNSCSRLF